MAGRLLPVYSTAVEPPYNWCDKCEECGVVCRQFTICESGDPNYYALICNRCLQRHQSLLSWVDALSVRFRLCNSWFYQIGLTHIVKEITNRYESGDAITGQYILVGLLMKLKRYRQI